MSEPQADLDLVEPFRSVLVSLAKYFDRADSDGRLEDRHIGLLGEHGVNVGIVRAGLGWLETAGYLFREQHARPGTDELSSAYILTADGATAVYKMILHATQQADPVQAVPASNRFVTLDHNRAPVDELTEKLRELEGAVQGNNDVFASDRERLSVLSEVQSIREVLKAEVVRSQFLTTAISPGGVLRWLAESAATGVVGNLATEAIKLILRMTGLN